MFKEKQSGLRSFENARSLLREMSETMKTSDATMTDENVRSAVECAYHLHGRFGSKFADAAADEGFPGELHRFFFN